MILSWLKYILDIVRLYHAFFYGYLILCGTKEIIKLLWFSLDFLLQFSSLLLQTWNLILHPLLSRFLHWFTPSEFFLIHWNQISPSRKSYTSYPIRNIDIHLALPPCFVNLLHVLLSLNLISASNLASSFMVLASDISVYDILWNNFYYYSIRCFWRRVVWKRSF